MTEVWLVLRQREKHSNQRIKVETSQVCGAYASAELAITAVRELVESGAPFDWQFGTTGSARRVVKVLAGGASIYATYRIECWTVSNNGF